MIKDRFVATLLTISILASFIGVLCSDVHADNHCPSAGTSCSALHGDTGGKSPCTPDNDHPDGDHCKDCCSCPCHTFANESTIKIKHSPFLAYLIIFEPFSAIPDVVIPKFVPPERPA